MSNLCHSFCFLLLTVFASAFASSADSAAAARNPASFSRDVLPILSENCFQCHGPDERQRQAELRLDNELDAVVVLNRPGGIQSELLRRIESEDRDEVMPPPDVNLTLTDAQKATLRRWILSGSEWQQHWSFEPLAAPPTPRSTFRETPVLNAIDHFVQARLKDTGLSPSAQADRAVLLRRVNLDLTGLPPVLQEQRAFVHDGTPGAYERVVDRLLESPAYGEHMAWNWLNAARYADSNGYQGDRERTMWPWREWVVDAFNQNMPFDEFTINQLAGDLLSNPTFEQKLATGFCRNHMINGEGGRIPEENRVDYVMDMTETMGTVWLGLTLNCCRCHDHKFDALRQRDYYQFYAFFNQTPVDGAGGDPQTTPTIAALPDSDRPRLLAIEQELAAVNHRLGQVRRKTAQENTALISLRDRLIKERDDILNSAPKVMIMEDRTDLRETFILTRGLYNVPTDRMVVAATPASLPSHTIKDQLNRLDLAKWLVSRENPLTSRVTVNRFWQQIFGLGLVRTTEDFGVQGEYPVHRELLDWLSADFRDHGWDVKRLIRTIVTSHTYRQSSRIRMVRDSNNQSISELEIDPENRLFARSPRYRLPSGVLRDQALASCGLLNVRRGGPPINTYQPPGVWAEPTFGKKKHERTAGTAGYRRSLYVFWRRIIAPTIFFDNATRQTCTVRVFRTNSPLHSLLTFNETTYVESARTLAQQLLEDRSLDNSAKLRTAFECIVCRKITADELTVFQHGLERSRSEFRADIDSATALLCVGDSKRNKSLDTAEHAAWTSLCLAILNLDETLTRE